MIGKEENLEDFKRGLIESIEDAETSMDLAGILCSSLCECVRCSVPRGEMAGQAIKFIREADEEGEKDKLN